MRILFFLFLFINVAKAQLPAGYYNGCGGTGTTLKLNIHNVISPNHITLGYSSLWNSFKTTDVKPNGKLWDVYSFVFTGAQPYEFTIGGSGLHGQCGTYSQEGDCYNREHTWPQTFFGSMDPMVCDLNQIFPTDGSVNGVHGNDPYGDVKVVNKTTLQGAKSGTSLTYPGYSNNVFEPIDSFKGDIARCYFYMNVRYTTLDGGWGNWTMANGAELKPDAIKLLLKWHHLDPVSQKEIDRNEEVFKIQGNRNPFIDHPEFADCIWDTMICAALSLKPIAKPNYSLYNNSKSITINNFQNHNCKFVIYTIDGRKIFSGNFIENTIDISNLNNGFYILKLIENNNSYNFSFIK
jgi:endonuclease I